MSRGGVAVAAQPFLAAMLHRLFPRRPLVIITASLRAQEVFHQDLTTWMAVEPESASPQPWFYPGWEILPHEDRLPHADVISERLETLVALCRPGLPGTSRVPVVVTSVIALLQRTFAPAALAGGTRAVARGDRCDPLGLVEWLEEQGYEPEAQATEKGEIALRGGILDVYPLTSPWPVRLEFFGDELESLRHFDPLTQISREEVTAITLPPAGELGILRRARSGSLGTLLDYLPAETILLLCEPEQLDEQAQEYGCQVPQGDAFFVSWQEFQGQAEAKGMTVLNVAEAGSPKFGDQRWGV